MAGTTVPHAKQALKALLESHTWPDDAPTIRWGGPTKEADYSRKGRMVYFGDTTIEDESVVLGNLRRDETYSLQIIIEAFMYGDGEQDAELAAWDLYNEVVAVLDSDPGRTLSGTVNRLQGREVRQQNVPLTTQWLCRIIVDQQMVGLFLT